MDILILEKGDGGEVLFHGGDIATDDGLFTAVYVSLFTGETFYNPLLPVSERYSRDLIDSLNEPITSESLRVVESKTENVLQWMLDEGVASSVEVSASSTEYNRINIEISITEPDENNNKFVLVWDAERLQVARFFDVSNGGYGLGE